MNSRCQHCGNPFERIVSAAELPTDKEIDAGCRACIFDGDMCLSCAEEISAMKAQFRDKPPVVPAAMKVSVAKIHTQSLSLRVGESGRRAPHSAIR